MDKVLVICGPTSTGKTQLAFKLARKFNGVVVSADSRQVYRHMDIGTGKERSSDVEVWGYDLVEPNEDFSVSEFVKKAKKEIKQIINLGKLPIVVGGTGLYIKSLFEDVETIDIPKNEGIRNSLEDKGVDELFEKLAILDPSKAASLNLSDRNNPRRLVRAIEVAIFTLDNPQYLKNKNIKQSDYDVLYIGLKMDINTLSEKIANKIDDRINMGFVDEVESLLKMGVSWKNQSMKAIGYKESEQFFKNGLTYEDFISLWHRNEVKYVKRQMTWFNKQKKINWYDAKNPDILFKVEKMVDKWDNINYEEN